jgi:hypothetical protein
LALYFFHLRDGEDALLDPEGREVADASRIAELALKEARAIVSQDALAGQIHLKQFIEVRDRDGKPVHRLDLRDAVAIR